MSSLINRLFHKILAKRIENTIALDPRQKVFIRRDGIAEKMFLLKNIIYQHKQKLNPLQICLLDVSKALDSVSHDAIIAISNRAGLPKTIIEYIKHSFTNCKTQLKYKKGISPYIAVNRGVKQGDPTSPLLFNAVIDYAISDLPSSISIHNNNIVKYMTFADDRLFFSKVDSSLQPQVGHVLYRLKECGLDINPEKSAILNIINIINPKKKQWICNPYSFILINNTYLKPLTIDDTYTYLGIEIGPIDKKNNKITTELTTTLLLYPKHC